MDHKSNIQVRANTEEQGGGFSAWCDPIPAVGTGDTREDAIESLAVLLSSFLNGHRNTLDTIRAQLTRIVHPSLSASGFNFGDAIALMREGKKVCRRGWNGKNMWIALLHPDNEIELMSSPFVYMRTADGQFVPWLASQTDMLAEDWEISPSS